MPVSNQNEPKSVREKIEDWWNGTFVPYENDPSSGTILIGGNQERHWTSRVARAVVDFLKREWKWVIGIPIAIIFGASLP